MSGWLFLSLIVIAIFFIALKIHGSSERRSGSIDERRKEARRVIASIDRALEELSSPLPDRDELSERWVRRINPDNRDDSTMSDTK
tara:strand:- start:5096 stop:5353 length:258 start_codon:yes stop_codon:yes gene_type:complete